MDKRVTVSSKNVKLIYANRICCFDNEQTDIKIELTNKKEDELRLSFYFKYSNSSEPKVDIHPNTKAGIDIKLTNFNNPLGMGLKRPILIGKLDAKSVFMLFNIYKNDDSNPILDLSLYMESSNVG